jgi:hypothetical protein
LWTIVPVKPFYGGGHSARTISSPVAIRRRFTRSCYGTPAWE